MEKDMWLPVASTWQLDPISEQSCDWLNYLGHSNMEVDIYLGWGDVFVHLENWEKCNIAYDL